MAKKKNNNFGMSIGILLVIIGIPLLFVLSSMGTSWLATTAPYVMVAVIAVFAAIYTGMTSSLLWDFYEEQAPWYRWVPCFGELTIMDSKFLKIGGILYIPALVCLGLSQLPYSVLSFMGETIALNFPFYMMVLAFIFLGIIQIVKGIGIMDCTKTIASIWEERNSTSSGFIKRFGFLGFIPFVRVVAVYALNKPLTTMVTFNEETISDDDDVELSEEDEEDDE